MKADPKLIRDEHGRYTLNVILLPETEREREWVFRTQRTAIAHFEVGFIDRERVLGQ